MSGNKRNGEIDFFKFIFAMIILLYHGRILGSAAIGDQVLFMNGYLSVEFFFMLSGFFFIPSIERFRDKYCKTHKDVSVFTENLSFIWGKLCGILGIYILSVIFSLVVYTLEYIEFHPNFHISSYLFVLSESIWDVLLLNSAVLSNLHLNVVYWYLSALYIVMFILYPIVVKKKVMFLNYICPIGSLLLLSVLTGAKRIDDNYTLTSINISGALVRATASIMIGCIIYGISRKCFQEKKKTATQRLFLTLCGYLSIGFSMMIMNFYTVTYIKGEYDWRVNFVSVFTLALGVFAITSGQSITNRLFNNRISAFLGKLSMSLFLFHIPCRRIIMLYGYEGRTYHERLLNFTLLSLTVSIVALFIEFVIKKRRIF